MSNTEYFAMDCYCYECDSARVIVDDEDDRALLDCGHIVQWDDGAGIWKSLTEPALLFRNKPVEIST